VLVGLLAQGRLTGAPLLFAVVAGVLSSVVPYATDLTALRYVPARFFGVFMSCHPVLAALTGLVLLGQVLDTHEWLGIAMVVAANAAAVATSAPSRSRPRVSARPIISTVAGTAPGAAHGRRPHSWETSWRTEC
jgi:inner membrane transporter RhtA